MLTGVDVKRVFARTTAHFHQASVDNDVEDLANEFDARIVLTDLEGRLLLQSSPGSTLPPLTSLIDPFGHKWSIATHVRDVSPEEMNQAAQAMFA